jgi:pimeloyl-ACP methyl ester carboxylesterase
MDIFIGGGGDDLHWLGLGVVRDYAAKYSRLSGQPSLYLPNARTGRAAHLIEAGVSRGEAINIIGHSWGAVDAYAAAVAATRRGLAVTNLITLDPVSGPWRRPPEWPGGVFWLNVDLAPSMPDASDRLTKRRPFAVKPSRLPTDLADARVVLDLNHRDVEPMMRLSGAQTRLIQPIATE